MLLKVWYHISFAGINPNNNAVSSRSLVLSNQMSAALMLLTLGLLFAMWLLFPENTVMLSWLSVLAFSLTLGVVLNARGHTKFSQYMLSSGLPLILLVSTIHSKLHHPLMIHEGSYYNPRFFLIGLSFVPLVVFDLRQRTALMISLALNLGILVLYNPLHRWAGASPEKIGLGDVDLTFVSVASSSAAVAIVLGMIFLKRANFRFENRISDLLKKTSHQNDELTAGIRYARKLQESILSKDVVCGASNDQAALFLKPKDVLSGDFYYCEERSGKIVLGVVDCTGHGVPGAFVSIMAYRALRASVEADETLNPATILDLTNVQFQKEFNTSQSQMNDGMDVSLCVIDPIAKTVEFAGARGLLFLWQNNQLHSLDADRRSIGEPSIHAFHRRQFNYKSGDMLFLSSDGFPDQFGGLGDKKFGKPRFRKLLSELGNYPVNTIGSRLTYVLQEWKDGTEQTDDICVVAFRLK